MGCLQVERNERQGAPIRSTVDQVRNRIIMIVCAYMICFMTNRPTKEANEMRSCAYTNGYREIVERNKEKRGERRKVVNTNADKNDLRW
jgi:hypothetical protein